MKTRDDWPNCFFAPLKRDLNIILTQQCWLLLTHCIVGQQLVIRMQNPGSIFKSYTMRGCQFECRMRHAIKKSNCIPWDYPVPQDVERNGGINLCVSYKDTNGTNWNPLQTFEMAMQSETSLINCTCLPDCEEVIFKTQVCLIQCCS